MVILHEQITPNQTQINEPHQISAQNFQSLKIKIEASPILNQEITPQNLFSHITSYRPDIDGLRTLAIIFVIIFHAFPKTLPGGFIGVDIFFVISGYLISQIIVKNNERGTFSYIDFYARRVKRIYPALIVVLITTLFFVGQYSKKNQFTMTIGTLKASTFFAANVEVMTYKQGYFDAELRINPLLHLWSLGVEEQFYIVWPLLLTISHKFWKKRMIPILVLCSVLSFSSQIVNIEEQPKFAFYFPICRFWEMIVGGIIACLSLRIRNPKIQNFLSALGILAISILVFILDELSKFPGYWALIPTLATAIIIQSKDSFINKYILSSKPFVSIGKISFSLYLWHWPFLILCHTYFPQGSQSILSNSFFILLIVFGLSVGTYFLVENPLRKLKSKKWAIVLLFLMAGIFLSSFLVEARVLPKFDENMDEMTKYLVAAEEDLKPIYPDDYFIKDGRRYANPSINKKRMRPTIEKMKVHWRKQTYEIKTYGKEKLLDSAVDQSSVFWDKRIPNYFRNFEVSNPGQSNLLLLIGDSHNLRISHRFQQLYKESIIKFTSFPTIVSMVRFRLCSDDEGDHEAVKLLIEFVGKHRPKRILFTRHWLWTWCDDRTQLLSQSANCNMELLPRKVELMVNFIRALKEFGCQIAINELPFQISQSIIENMMDIQGNLNEELIKPFRKSDFEKKYKHILDIYHQALRPFGLNIISFSDNHCWEDICQKFTPSGYPVFSDFNHFGIFYARHWVTAADHLAHF